jgi:hypothetical protein
LLCLAGTTGCFQPSWTLGAYESTPLRASAREVYDAAVAIATDHKKLNYTLFSRNDESLLFETDWKVSPGAFQKETERTRLIVEVVQGDRGPYLSVTCPLEVDRQTKGDAGDGLAEWEGAGQKEIEVEKFITLVKIHLDIYRDP